MNVSVIISTYNRPDALICVLDSLNKQDCMSFEVIVADDGSVEETKIAIDLRKYEIRLLQNLSQNI